MRSRSHTFAVSAASALLSLLWATRSEAQWTARVVTRAAGAPSWSSEPVQARVGEAVEAQVLLRDASGRYYAQRGPVRVQGHQLRLAGTLPAGAVVRWDRVVPLLEHRALPPPDPTQRGYSNAVLFGPRHGRWRGYDRLEYSTHALQTGEGLEVGPEGLTLRSAAVLAPGSSRTPGAGTLFLAATVELTGGVTIRTPAEGARDQLGLRVQVARVSYRASDDFLGWLGTYFGVPYVFASNGPTAQDHQTSRYVGADCADVLVGARRAAGENSLEYTSVAGIGRYARAVSAVLFLGPDGVVRDGAGSPVTLRWGTEVLPGDLVAIDYTHDPSNELPRAWDHIGALLEDAGTPGILDGADVLRHAGLRGLQDQALVAQAPLRFLLWRWRSPRVSARR